MRPETESGCQAKVFSGPGTSRSGGVRSTMKSRRVRALAPRNPPPAETATSCSPSRRLPGRKTARSARRCTSRVTSRPSSHQRSFRNSFFPPRAVNTMRPFRFGPTRVPFVGPVTVSVGVETTRAAITPPAVRHAATTATISATRGLIEIRIGGSTVCSTAGGAPSRNTVSRRRAAERISAVGPRAAVRSAQRMNSSRASGSSGSASSPAMRAATVSRSLIPGALAVVAPIARTSDRTSSFTRAERIGVLPANRRRRIALLPSCRYRDRLVRSWIALGLLLPR